MCLYVYVYVSLSVCRALQLCYVCVTCTLVCQCVSPVSCRFQVQLQKMFDKERQIRSTTEQFALQLQLSRQEANECATAMQQFI